jgi:hypothetical protein
MKKALLLFCLAEFSILPLPVSLLPPTSLYLLKLDLSQKPLIFCPKSTILATEDGHFQATEN